MGNETSVYDDCKLDKPLVTSTKSEWTLHPATCRNGTEVSVFMYPKNKQVADYIENSAKYLKVLRHPGILKFLDVKKSSEGYKIITEECTPLESIIENLSSAEICAELHNVVEVLDFLHDKGSVCHNNISPSCIFVTSEGSWKLGGFDYLCPYNKATTDYLERCKAYRDERFIAPEEKNAKYRMDIACGHARDAYAFGMLAECMMEYLTDLGDLTKTFSLRIQDEFLHDDPDQRPPLSSILEDRLFKSGFVEISTFLRSITLKSEEEKRVFFTGLVAKLYTLPVELIAARLARPLLARFVLLDFTAEHHLLPHLLTPFKGTVRPEYTPGHLNPILPVALFRKHVIPEIFKIFHVRDAHIRRVMLTFFTDYVAHFNKENLESTVLPLVLLGLKDLDDNINMMSMHALAEMIPYLGGEVVIGTQRSRIFAMGTPKFKAHANGIDVSPEKKTAPAQEIKSILKHSSEPEKKTLKQLAQDADKMKKREEMKDDPDKIKKREEMRKRAEERKRLREEKRKNKQKDQKMVAVKTDTVLPQIENDDGLDTVTTPDIDSTPLETHVTESKTRISISSDKASDHDSYSRHSDFDNDDSFVQSPNDSDIELEIENQLSTMDSTLPHKPVDSPRDKLKVESPPPIVKVDWSDASYDNSKTNTNKIGFGKGALKLGKTKTSPPPEKEVENVNTAEHDTQSSKNKNSPQRTKKKQVNKKSEDDNWGSGWGNEEAESWSDIQSEEESENITNNDVSGLNSDTFSHIPSVQKPQAKPTSNKPLGSEFDILAIDIKTTKPSETSEVDLFADMIPDIKPSQNNIFDLLNDKGDKKGSDKGTKPMSMKDVITGKDDKKGLSFAVQEQVQAEDGEGWGDDGWDDIS